MQLTIKQKRGTASAISTANPTLSAGELAFETDTGRFKVGDGSTAWSSLEYVRPYLSATDRLLGRSSSGAGSAEEILCTAAGRALLDDADAAAQRTTLGAAPSANPVFTGVAEFAVGTASAPSVTFAGDTDSGIYRSAADAISITCGTYEILTTSLAGLSVRHYLASTPTNTAVSDLNRPVATVLQRVATGYHTYLHGYHSGQSTGVFLSGANADLASLSCGMSMQTVSGLFPSGSVTYRSYRSKACSIELNDGNVVIRSTTTGTADNAAITYTGAGNVALAVTASRNVLIGGNATPTSGVATLCVFNGTAPTASVADGVVLYAEDVSASSVLKVRDEAGNINILSGAAVFSQVVTVPAGTAGAPAIFSTTGTSDTGLFFPAADTVAVSTAATERCRITSAGNVLVGGTASPTSGVANLVLFNGTAPTASVTDGVVLFAADVSASSELRVRDEAGNVTTLSPHRFDLIPGGPSEPMAWAYYSERDGHKINVDMLRLARLVEKLTGEQLVYEEAPP